MEKHRYNILKHALALFCDSNYESVTIRDIAESANISPADIYRYYNGKEAILEAVYQRYCDSLLANMPRPEAYIPVLEKGTVQEILNIFSFNMPEPHDLNVYAFRIVMARRASDVRANEIYLRNAWEPSLSFIKEIMQKGVEIGRLSMTPDDISIFAHHILAVREYAATIALVVPDEDVVWRKILLDTTEHMSPLLQPYMVDRNTSSAPAKAPDAFAGAIRTESLAVSKYYHYSGVLKRRGEARLSALVNEVVANVLDEINTLYSVSGQTGELLSSAEILRQIADSERLKRLEAEKAAETAEGDLCEIYREIAELARQHERIFLENPK